MFEVTAAQLIAHERLQLVANGLTPDVEDGYDREQLAEAATGYQIADGPSEPPPWNWPFGKDEWRPAHRLTNLARAGAYYQAEVDRLTRLLTAAHCSMQICADELAEAMEEDRKDRTTCTNCGGQIPADEARAGFTECERCGS